MSTKRIDWDALGDRLYAATERRALWFGDELWITNPGQRARHPVSEIEPDIIPPRTAREAAAFVLGMIVQAGTE